ncbi:hypothetical protein [Haloferula sp.]
MIAKSTPNAWGHILLPLVQQRLAVDLADGVYANSPKIGKASAKVAGLG